MPLIPFPDVPNYPGVPAIVRSATSSTAVNIALSTVGGILLSSLQSQTQWGIFDSAGNQLGGVSSLSFVDSLISVPTILSTYSFDYLKEMRISDFPIEQGSFASYNKVQMPANPVVSLSLSGSESDRTAFLTALDAAIISTELYMVATPEMAYVNYSIERYRMVRKAEKGATLLTVEISLKEIRDVSAGYASIAKPLSPQSPDASAQTNGGIVQTTPAPQSTALQIVNWGKSFFGPK